MGRDSLAKKEQVGEGGPARVFLDTSVWLDLAGNDASGPLLGALENLSKTRAIEVVVPQIVRDEFARNRERIIKESGRSLLSALKRAKVAVLKYGDKRQGKKAAQLMDDIEHRIQSTIDVTAEAVERIESVFKGAAWLGDPEAAMAAASKRALERKAPFHSGKNNFADAVIIELYGQLAGEAKDESVFVTHNVRDFSLPSGDQRAPHADIAGFFSGKQSRYFIKLIGAFRALIPHQFDESMYDQEFTLEPRKASEIYAAIEELFDRVWYDRHMVMMHKIETGKCRVIPPEEFGPKFYKASGYGRVVVADVLAQAMKAAQRVENKYGKENLGPYSKFDWGMINGKLSALRWVMGDEWDMLDT
jgi:predicted nucleic acid-binding protein